jgi:tetratricopeptide (TPR) repeat protein
MELVEGSTLKRWLAHQPRSMRQILSVFRRAGEGLAAAHAAGLVHRDVKPDNVLMADDGRVLVTDFGLARPSEGDADTTLADDSAPVGSHLTHTGALIGTPAYMSPEQLAGGEATSRSDVFSFCVALYEALYQERPFAGDSMAEVRQAIAAERVRAPTEGARIPGWLRRVLLRGLRASPDERFAGMDPLLAALGRDPARVWRWAGLSVAVIAAVVLAGLVGQRLQANRALCRGGPHKITVAWNDERRARVRQAILSSSRPFAPSTWAALERSLDEYASGWTTMFADACEATRVRGEQSEEVMQLRMTCLGTRLDELAALTALFEKPGGVAVEAASEAPQHLTPLASCADVESLVATVRPPTDPARRARVEELRRRAAAVHAQYAAGQYAKARANSTALRDEVTAVGYAPLNALVQSDLGSIQDRLGEYKASEESFFAAALAAERGHDDDLAARCWIALVNSVGYTQDRVDEAHRWARVADAAVARLGERHPEIQADLLDVLGGLAVRANNKEKALDYARRVVELSARRYSPEHAEMRTAYSGLAVAQQLNRLESEALVSYRHAMAIGERVFGPDHPRIADLHFNVGTALNNTGQLDEAEREYRRALAIGEAALGKDHVDLAWYADALANLFTHTRRSAEALPFAERALAIRVAGLDKSHADVGNSEATLAEVLFRLGRARDALPHIERAIAIYDKTSPDGAGVTGRPLLAEVLIALGQNKRALAIMERDTVLVEPQKLDALVSAPHRFALAEALAATGGDPARARALLLEAKRGWQMLPALYPDELASAGALLNRLGPR